MPEQSTIRVRIRELALSLEEGTSPQEALLRMVSQQLKLPIDSINALEIVQRAIDARHRSPKFRFTVEFTLDHHTATKILEDSSAEIAQTRRRKRWKLPSAPQGPKPVVVGAGPAGLFAAITLAEAGLAPIIFERGKPVEDRGRDVSQLYSRGSLNRESNVCYGEGGAGTYSDGKLYTRVTDERIERFMRLLVQHGANPDILINNRPHLGTDKLVTLLKSVRAYLTSLGAEFRFSTAVDDLLIRDQKLTGLKLRDGESVDARQVILATGHSARGMWHKLEGHGIQLETRPFAVGFRVEHPQGLIDEIRYGDAASSDVLPSADYKLAHNSRGSDARGVYSFCMCPGGVVVTTPTEPDGLCINGMSHAARSGRFANSALVVTVTPEDYAAAGHHGLFAGVEFQKEIETRAYTAGGGHFVAPASRLVDFAQGRASRALGATSYRRGIVPSDLAELYPAPIIDALRNSLEPFERKMRGFLTEEATLIGVETRTASPIRVVRDPQTLETTGVSGIYPVGEGMGYGGGISSAAVDGMRAAESLLETLGATCYEAPFDSSEAQ